MLDLISSSEAGINPGSIRNLSHTDYDRIVSSLIVAERNTQWWLGDLIRFGEELYPDTWSQSISIASDYQIDTLMDYARVASMWPLEHRLTPDLLSYNHHREIISSKYGYQTIGDMIQWRDRAVTEQLSIRSLRAALKLSRHAVTSQSETEPSSGVVDAPVEPVLLLDGRITASTDVTGDVDFEGESITIEPGAELKIVGPSRVRVIPCT